MADKKKLEDDPREQSTPQSDPDVAHDEGIAGDPDEDFEDDNDEAEDDDEDMEDEQTDRS